jgi:hypothetical protein
MSLPNSANQPLEKQRTNIYTMMLILSFLALVTGSIILSMEWEKFDGDPRWSTSEASPKAAQ